jgi:hypothetical protein
MALSGLKSERQTTATARCTQADTHAMNILRAMHLLVVSFAFVTFFAFVNALCSLCCCLLQPSVPRRTTEQRATSLVSILTPLLAETWAFKCLRRMHPLPLGCHCSFERRDRAPPSFAIRWNSGQGQLSKLGTGSLCAAAVRIAVSSDAQVVRAGGLCVAAVSSKERRVGG